MALFTNSNGSSVIVGGTGALPVGIVWNRDQGLIDSGTYFIATSPTPGTAIATTTSITVEDQTKPVMLIHNKWGHAMRDKKYIYPLSLDLIVRQVPTSASFWQCSIRLDNDTPNKYVSGGTLIRPEFVSSESIASSMAEIRFGDITALTSSSQGKLTANSMLSVGAVAQYDLLRLEFGSGSQSSFSDTKGPAIKVTTIAPMVIGPDGWMSICMWGTGNAAAPSFEFQLNYVEI